MWGGTFNEAKNIYYFFASIVNQTQSGIAVVGIDPTTGNIKSKFLTCPQFYPTKPKFDPQSLYIYAGAEEVQDGEITYSYLQIDGSKGECTSQPVDTSEGIVTAWAYDQLAGNIWYADATNGGYLLRGVSVETGDQIASYNTKYILESIEITP